MHLKTLITHSKIIPSSSLGISKLYKHVSSFCIPNNNVLYAQTFKNLIPACTRSRQLIPNIIILGLFVSKFLDPSNNQCRTDPNSHSYFEMMTDGVAKQLYQQNELTKIQVKFKIGEVVGGPSCLYST